MTGAWRRSSCCCKAPASYWCGASDKRPGCDQDFEKPRRQHILLWRKKPQRVPKRTASSGRVPATPTDRRGQAEEIERNQTAESGEGDVDGMGFGVDQKIHGFGAVMHGVEARQQGISWRQR